MKDKIMLFTHTDLDGAGCRIVANVYAKKHNLGLDVVHLNYGQEMINTMKNFFSDLGNKDKYFMVFIGDLSFKEDNQHQELIDLMNKYIGNSIFSDVIVFDHHPSSVYLNKYTWAHIQEEDLFGDKQCGASLMQKVLLKYEYIEVNKFIDYVRKYDTWEWVYKYDKCNTTLQIQTMFELYGMDKFCSDILLRKENKQNLLPNESELIIINNQLSKLEKYYELKANQLKVCKYGKGDLKLGIVIAEDSISLLGDYILSRELCDVLAIYNPNYQTVSLRTKKNIDLNIVANKFGSGGHKQAAGFKLECNSEIVNLLAEEIDYNA